MSAERARPSPDLEGLLREVAADPQAALFVIPPEKAVRIALDAGTRLGTAATGLVAAERELLRVHRDELAYLLRHACVMRLFSMERIGAYVIRRTTRTAQHDVWSQSMWRRKTELELQFALDAGLDRERFGIVRSLIDADAPQHASVAQLAASSARFAPSPQARLYAGMELHMTRQSHSAARIFESVAAEQACPEVSSTARTSLGNVRNDLDDVLGALAEFESAVRCDGSRLAPLFNLLQFSLIAGRETRALEAARRLDDLVQPDHPAIGEYVEYLSHPNRIVLRTDPIFTTTLRRIEERIGPTALKVIHAIR